MTTKNDRQILLESGTNELELLVFSLGSQRYGVNVAKVREVIEPLTITALPQSHPAIVGVFQLRDAVTSLMDLKQCLGKGSAHDLSVGKIIIMEFNDARVGFLVDAVEQIYRVNWKSVSAIPDLEGVRDAPLTSIAFINDEMISMIDFERLVFQVGGVDLFEEHARSMPQGASRGERRILFAEDSRLMRTVIHGNLVKAGYTDVTVFPDGQDAWEALEEDVTVNGRTTFDVLITDIEMPRVDGLHLTRRIKEDARMKHLPIVIFSSLVSMDNEKKCRAVGADAQITKPQLDQLVSLIDELVDKKPVHEAGAVTV